MRLSAVTGHVKAFFNVFLICAAFPFDMTAKAEIGCQRIPNRFIMACRVVAIKEHVLSDTTTLGREKLFANNSLCAEFIPELCGIVALRNHNQSIELVLVYHKYEFLQDRVDENVPAKLIDIV